MNSPHFVSLAVTIKNIPCTSCTIGNISVYNILFRSRSKTHLFPVKSPTCHLTSTTCLECIDNMSWWKVNRYTHAVLFAILPSSATGNFKRVKWRLIVLKFILRFSFQWFVRVWSTAFKRMLTSRNNLRGTRRQSASLFKSTCQDRSLLYKWFKTRYSNDIHTLLVILDCHIRSWYRQFKSTMHQFIFRWKPFLRTQSTDLWACVAQWRKELTRNPKVVGSNPLWPTCCVLE